jgi:hypothetical protein
MIGRRLIRAIALITLRSKALGFARRIAVGAVRFRQHSAVVLWVRLRDAICTQSEQWRPCRPTVVIFTDLLTALLAVKCPMWGRVPGAIRDGALFLYFGVVLHDQNPIHSGCALARGVNGAASRCI